MGTPALPAPVDRCPRPSRHARERHEPIEVGVESQIADRPPCGPAPYPRVVEQEGVEDGRHADPCDVRVDELAGWNRLYPGDPAVVHVAQGDGLDTRTLELDGQAASAGWIVVFRLHGASMVAPGSGASLRHRTRGPERSWQRSLRLSRLTPHRRGAQMINKVWRRLAVAAGSSTLFAAFAVAPAATTASAATTGPRVLLVGTYQGHAGPYHTHPGRGRRGETGRLDPRGSRRLPRERRSLRPSPRTSTRAGTAASSSRRPGCTCGA